jgi:hypothetical protein
VVLVQYTFTHKQYTEQHKTNNTYNNSKNIEHGREESENEECMEEGDFSGKVYVRGKW